MNRLWIAPALVAILAAGCVMPRIIIPEDPLAAEEHLNLGVAYERKGELDLAIREYELAAKKTGKAYLYLGNVYFQKKELDRAEESYRKAIREIPREADAYNNLAWVYFVRGKNLDEAEKLALKAIELNPSGSETYTDTLEKIRRLKNKSNP